MRQNLRLDAEVLNTWHTFETENACVRLVPPQLAYIPAEVIDGEEQSPQVCFVWPLKQKTMRLYISEERVLISDPNGSFIRTSIQYIRLADSNSYCDDRASSENKGMIN